MLLPVGLSLGYIVRGLNAKSKRIDTLATSLNHSPPILKHCVICVSLTLIMRRVMFRIRLIDTSKRLKRMFLYL